MTSGGNYSSQVPAGEDYREVQLPDYKVQEGKHIIQSSVISQKYLVRSKPAPVNVCGDPTTGRST